MAKTSYIVLSPEQSDLFYKNLKSGDRFTFSKIVLKKTIFSRKAIKGLRARSFLPMIAEAWNSFSEAEKEAWKVAGVASNMKGYNAFVKDKSIRIKNAIAGNATPTVLHQSWCGFLEIEAPATEIQLIQFHPHTYWVSRKVAGKKGMYEPVEVIEDLSLPLKVSCSYKSNLVSTGAGSFARLFARVRSSYQGEDRFTDCTLDFSLVSDWANIEETLSSVVGHIISYNLYIHLYNVRGLFLCDNIKAEHSGQNWVRDTQCNDIDQAFTRAFFQVPKHWVATIINDGGEFGTLYPED